MPYEFYLKHLNRDGTIKNAFVLPLQARYTNSVSGDEPLTFTLDGEADAVSNLVEFDIILVYIRNLELGMTNNGGFILDFVGILRDIEITADDDGILIYTYVCPNEKHLLTMRGVMYSAGRSNYADFEAVAAETVMKTIVDTNMTSIATTANNRWLDGDFSSMYTILIEDDLARGNLLSESLSGDNLIEALQELRRDAGGDWSLEYQSGNTFAFKFHLGQLGDDKRTGANAVTFSLDNNNMKRPSLKYNNRGTATRALVAGQGSQSSRLVTAVNSTTYSATNDIEIFIDARDLDTAAKRQTRGDIKLDERKPDVILDFDVNQTADSFYCRFAVTGRKVYREGDLVNAFFAGQSFTRKIEKVTVDIRNGQSDNYVQISIQTEEI